jgi:hypothetical protein
MKLMIKMLKTNLKYLIGLALATIIGGATTAVVLASIPDSSGVIHGCRSNINGSLRVIDSENSGNCLPSEASLNWNQTGKPEQLALAHITYDPSSGSSSLDTSRSTNVISFVDTPYDHICLQTNFVPKNITSSSLGEYSLMEIKDQNGWSGPNGNSYCGDVPNSNVFMLVPHQDFFIAIH